MSEPGLFDFCIVNGDLSQAYAELRIIASKAKNGQLPEESLNGELSPINSPLHKERSMEIPGLHVWRDKIALVTQAGSPLGVELCTALCKGGLRIVAIGQSREDLKALQGKLMASGCGPLSQIFLPVVCDTTKEAEVLSLKKILHNRWPEASTVDILINNASLKT